MGFRGVFLVLTCYLSWQATSRKGKKFLQVFHSLFPALILSRLSPSYFGSAFDFFRLVHNDSPIINYSAEFIPIQLDCKGRFN